MPDRRPWDRDKDDDDDPPRRPRRRDDGEDDEDDDRPRNRRRPDDDEDDRPRSRRRRDDDDYDDEPPPRRRRKGPRVLLILLAVFGGLVVLCCGGAGLYMWLGPKPVTILDASRTPSTQGGTQSVTVTMRISATRPGGRVDGNYNFMFKAGNRTSVQPYTIRGREGGDDKHTFLTPELVKEPGPVEFWVEREERGDVSRVSEVRTIP